MKILRETSEGTAKKVKVKDAELLYSIMEKVNPYYVFMGLH